MTTLTGVTFYLYKDSEGGAPLWIETQNVQPDKFGHYAVVLGSSTSQGLPPNLFTSGEARWLGVQVQGQGEQPRALLLSVPYALKAGDAQTVGGLPASAFVLAASPTPTGPNSPASASSSGTAPAASIGGGGSAGYLAAWTDNNGDLGNSIVSQSGTGSGAKIGINESKPLATLDVNGSSLMRGFLEMATTGLATPTKGFNSNPFNLESSGYNSGTKKYSLQHFVWQAEPLGNNTTSPSATLNLLFGTDPNNPAETGLQLSSTGIFTFATGQTFPGAGTITGITTASGSGLSGGGTSGTLSLSLTNTCTANQVLQWSGSAWVCSSAGSGTITAVTAGTDLTGGGTSGNVTLNLDTTKVAQLNSTNTFTGTQTITVNGGSEALNVTQQAVGGQTYGIIGTNFSAGNRSAAVLGQSLAGSGIVFGVEGYIADNDGAGVFGADGNPLSQTGGSLSGTFGSGIWGDGNSAGLGIIGTTDNNIAITAYNNSATASAIQGWNENTTNSTSALAPGVFGLSFAPKGMGVVGSGPVHSSTFSSYAGQFAYGVVGDGGPNNTSIGVGGMADAGTAIFGASTSSGTGVFGTSQFGNGVFGASSTGSGTSGQSSTGSGVYGASLQGSGVYGLSSSANGVYGEGDDASGSGGAGVYAFGKNTAAGVFSTTSGTASAVVGLNSTDGGNGGAPTALFINSTVTGQALVAGGSAKGAYCEIDHNGNLFCTGTIGSGHLLSDNRVVAVYAVQSPENWFEDFGSGSLSAGQASIHLDPTFRETVNASLDYHVFLTPKGECEGLYVANMRATAFEVRELHHGKSNVAFDYHIVAHRKNYENIRMEDVTAMHDDQVAMIQKTMQQSRQPSPSVRPANSAAQPQIQVPILSRPLEPAQHINPPVLVAKPKDRR